MQTLVDKVERAEQRRRKLRRMLTIVVPIVLVVLLAVGGFYYYFPFATGMKSGRLNYVVHKGLVFKTYEGRLIQAGIRPADTGGFQSNEFIFSVSDKEVAEQLMNAGGKTVELHYTEYLGALPWRGYSRYVVDRIVNITDNGGDGVAAPTEGMPDVM